MENGDRQLYAEEGIIATAGTEPESALTEGNPYQEMLSLRYEIKLFEDQLRERRLKIEGFLKGCGISDFNDNGGEALLIDAAVFKGRKPQYVLLPNGERAACRTWRKIAETILQNCDQTCHDALMQLCDNVFGRYRPVLVSSADELQAPIQVADGIYFEGRFDTESLLKMVVEVVRHCGYRYTDVRIRYL